SNDIKVEIPEYDGKLDPDEFVEWLRTVECSFDYKATTGENKVKIVDMKLRKYASTWWANTCTKRKRMGKPKRLGHIASECPNKKMITLAEFEEGDNSYTVDPTVESVVMIDHVVEEVVGPDERACLVAHEHSVTPLIRQTFSNETLYFTPVVSLYKSIGKSYEDQIWCNVIPMDACHVLLGRPWLFDRWVMHDGYKNTYFFNHNDRRIVLTPMSAASTPTKNQPLSTLLKAEQHEYYSIKDFILLGLDESKPKPPATLHPRIQPLLQSYNHVFPVEIPSGLPPLRTIQHKIDLFPDRTKYDHQFHLQQLFEGIQVDERKVQAIRDWPVPQSIQQFVWNPQAQAAFEELKNQLSSAPLLALPCFDEVFEVECDASGVGIGDVLLQLGRTISYFSEKLNDAKQSYSTYDKEFYAIVRALDHWQHYLISKEFILHSDHGALKYIQGQHKLRPRHAKWVEYLQAFTFTIKHTSGKLNKGADALSRKYALVNSLHPKVVGLELLSQNYPTDPDFEELFSSRQLHATGEYHLHNGQLSVAHVQKLPPKMAACSLQIRSLLDVTSEAVVDMIIEKTLEEIHKMFNLNQDLTFEEIVE
nr:hypothetical protein [Tanacetum cinerariifolium]